VEKRLIARCDLLVVAAFEPELTGLDTVTSVAEDAFASPLGGIVVVAAPVGIGLVEAALGTSSCLGAHAPRAVVLVGTCGAYPRAGLSIGDVVVARSALLVEPAVVRGTAALPEAISTRRGVHPAILTGLARLGAPAVDVATTLAVTIDDTLAEQLAAKGEVEHLEAFAVAAACAREGVPFAAVLGVANRVGANGRVEWRANHLAAGAAATRYVVRWIEGGAPGAFPSSP
jgi:nucleoside phosphorylase